MIKKCCGANTIIFWGAVIGLTLGAFTGLVAVIALSTAPAHRKSLVQTLPAENVAAQPSPTDTTGLSSEALAKEGWKTYKNEKYGFEFQYPENWKYEDFSVYRVEMGKKVGSINFFDQQDEFEIIRGSQSKKWTLILITPIPEVGLEDMKILEEKETKIVETNIFKVKIYEPRKNEEDDKYFILASHEPHKYEDSIILKIPSTKENLDYNKRLLDQILSTFKFTK